MWVLVLKGPAARSEPGARRGPIADHLKHLLAGDPIERVPDVRLKPNVADFHQRVTGERRVPDRRQAGLAIQVIAVAREQLAGRGKSGRVMRMIRRVSETIEHHHGICHRRENGAEPVLTVQPFGDEAERLFDRPAPPLGREERFDLSHHPVEDRKDARAERWVRRGNPVAYRFRELDE
jgi:hypothetical protein